MNVTVVVGTFGSDDWKQLAWERAIPSVPKDIPVIHVHGDSLADARNRALAQVNTEWVVHLDADDELEAGYFDRMAEGTADLRAPSVRYIRHGRERQVGVPKVAGHDHACTGDCLPQGNFIAVGALARVELIRSVGGWEEWPVYEDWALWARCWRAGGTVESIPAAVYRAHVNRQSRNRGPSIRTKNKVHYEIADAVFADAA